MFLYGFVGSAPCGGLLLEKLQACTQPGLDGYGAALMQGGQLLCVKSKESVAALAPQLPESAAPCGLVHARFATSGGRTAENVHPFVTDDYCLAMNGTVENAVALRSALNLLPYPDSDGAVLAALLQTRERRYRRCPEIWSCCFIALCVGINLGWAKAACGLGASVGCCW